MIHNIISTPTACPTDAGPIEFPPPDAEPEPSPDTGVDAPVEEVVVRPPAVVVPPRLNVPVFVKVSVNESVKLLSPPPAVPRNAALVGVGVMAVSPTSAQQPEPAQVSVRDCQFHR